MTHGEQQRTAANVGNVTRVRAPPPRCPSTGSGTRPQRSSPATASGPASHRIWGSRKLDSRVRSRHARRRLPKGADAAVQLRAGVWWLRPGSERLLL